MEDEMAVIAGLFDSEANATEAMDKLLRQNIEDLDTHVISPSGLAGDGEPNFVFPIVPNTGGMGSGTPGAPVPFVTGQGGVFGWFDDVDEVERAFYLEGLREGATLAMAKVHDADIERVRQVFRDSGARTYVDD
jgi:hypothetical protein